MPAPKIITVEDKIFWAYANLAMAHSAVTKGQKEYNRFNFIIRSRLYKGLKDGSMTIHSLFDDEKIKLETGKICNYCGSENNLSIDHIFPKKLGGTDNADNLVYACRSCNSSKGKKDLMEWMSLKDKFLPLMIIRIYLKLTYLYCLKNNLLAKQFDELNEPQLPFKIQFIPTNYPQPNELILTSGK